MAKPQRVCGKLNRRQGDSRTSANQVNQTMNLLTWRTAVLYNKDKHLRPSKVSFRNKTLKSWKMFLFKSTGHTLHLQILRLSQHSSLTLVCWFAKRSFILCNGVGHSTFLWRNTILQLTEKPISRSLLFHFQTEQTRPVWNP